MGVLIGSRSGTSRIETSGSGWETMGGPVQIFAEQRCQLKISIQFSRPS